MPTKAAQGVRAAHAEYGQEFSIALFVGHGRGIRGLPGTRNRTLSIAGAHTESNDLDPISQYRASS